ncbi:flagellar protein [Halalkalibacter nanhaiisediminis]|uniref:Flagellar protein FliT n=1 Tax=Halalkalibacter nanhaiisediminis TaxID=688079 RepID=A0A562QTM6_9BACI|nr:flagellar protein [Halalkalibacter nanhaiisediminis]TWI59963.1 flagellar protein FliT [Halalkalibacter nanhaiisediminis]
MSAVKELYLQTKELLDFINEPFPKDDDARDQYIAQLDERLVKREPFIKQVDEDSLSDAEKQLGQELIKLNQQLTKRMEQVRTEIQGNLNQLKAKKATSRKYENPYDGPSTDGVFFDKRGV